MNTLSNEQLITPIPDNGKPTAIDQPGPDFAARLKAVNLRIAQACERVDRQLSEVRLLPVSKTVSLSMMRTAIVAGCREFGENRVQEARHKAEALQDSSVRWSIIGHLQTNKAKYVARFAHELQSLDSEKLAQTLDRNLALQRRGIDVFVQVNSSFESSKYGLAIEHVPDFVRSLQAYEHLHFRGLMTLAVFGADEQAVRACFVRMRQLREQLQDQDLTTDGQCKLSMGMSGDFEIAIEEGADVVRVGQALFGSRNVPDSHYWPGV